MRTIITAFLLILWAIPSNLIAQSPSLNSETEARIDANFEEWNSLNSPGTSIGILRGDEIIYLKGFGSQNLVSSTPIIPETKFRIGGKSQHFTAFAILLLEDRGELSLEDDIHKYLPFLPNYNTRITIHNLLSHSSGLPDFWTVKSLSGFSETDLFTSDDAKELFSKKWELANQPGEEYLFSGTGGFLLAQIVEHISGMSISEFTKKEIFEPLGMNNTFFTENLASESILLSTPYSLEGEEFIPQVIGNTVPGPANLITSASDLMRWYKNLANPDIGSKKMMRKLDTRIQYKPDQYSISPNGWLTYGQQFDHFERSLKSIWDYGAMGGFASSVFRFTDNENLTIVVLSNNGLTYNGFLGMGIADVLLENEFVAPPQEPLSFLPLTEQIKDLFLGNYFNVDEFFQRQIILRDDTLRYYRLGSNTEDPLIPISSTELAMASPFGTNIITRYDEDGKERLEFRTEDASFVFEKYELYEYSENELFEFEGTFFSDDLSISYTIALRNGALIAKNNRVGDINLNEFKEDYFIGSTIFFNQVIFERDSQNNVIGFDLEGSTLKKVFFRKI